MSQQNQEYETSQLVAQIVDPQRHQSLIELAHQGYLWGRVLIPAGRANRVFLMLGTPGSGKSLQIEAIAKEGLRHIAPGSNRRALIHDPTGELRPKLVSNALAPVHSLNYYHRYAAKIDLAATIKGEEEARTLAELIIPDDKSNNQYFNRAARIIFQIILEYLARHCGLRWTLRDAVLLLRDVPLLKWLVQDYSDLSQKLIEGMAAAETEQNIRSTLLVKTTFLDRIAVCYEYLTEKVSPDSFLNRSSILHLSYQARAGNAQKQLYEFILNRLIQVALDSDQHHDQAMNLWLLDEFPGLTNLFVSESNNGEPLMGRFMRECRKLGNMIVLAAQNPQQISNLLRVEAAKAIFGLAEYQAYLSQNSSAAATFCSEMFGEMDIMESSYSNESANGIVQAIKAKQNATSKKVPQYLPEVFTNLKTPDLETKSGIEGIYRAESKSWRAYYSSQAISQMRMQADPEVPSHDLIPLSDRVLIPWNEQDLYRLNIHNQVMNYRRAHPDGQHLKELLVEDEKTDDDDFLTTDATP